MASETVAGEHRTAHRVQPVGGILDFGPIGCGDDEAPAPSPAPAPAGVVSGQPFRQAQLVTHDIFIGFRGLLFQCGGRSDRAAHEVEGVRHLVVENDRIRSRDVRAAVESDGEDTLPVALAGVVNDANDVDQPVVEGKSVPGDVYRNVPRIEMQGNGGSTR